MKKYVKWTLALVIVIIACFAYAHIDKMHAIFNEDIDPSLYVASDVASQEEFEQKFISEEDALDGVALKFNTTGEQLAKVRLVYSIENASGEIIRTGILEGEKFKNQKYNILAFDRIENSKNQEYVFKCHCENNDEVNGISILSENNTLVMKYYMSRFDVETFVIAVALCVYVMIFMKVLFKMFKE